MHARLVLGSLALMMVLSGITADAQERTGAWVNGSGVESLSRPATIMRMRIDLLAKGRGMKETLQRFKERRAAALTTLETLGATKDSIQIADPQINQQMAQQQNQMSMMMRDRMPGRTRKKGTEPAAPLFLTGTLTAEWNLAGADADALLLAAHEIQEKVAAADLSGLKDTSKLSPEEEELEAETSQMRQNPYGEQQPGQPQFFYVAKITNAEREKLFAAAFAKSKQTAELLAQAASLKLGKLQSMQGTAHGGGAEAMQASRYARYAGMPSTDDDSSPALEAIGVSPGKVAYVVQVQSTFSVE